jgi:predicted CXXCH cytochrome family protein
MRMAGMVLLGALALAGAGLFAQQTTVHTPAARGSSAARAGARNKSPNTATNNYIDPAWCAQCHADIAKTYALTGMGRSFTKITADTMKEDFPSDKPFFHEASQSYFSIVKRDGNVYERRWQIDYNGQETNVEEKQIDYVLGSGNHGRTYLHLTARGTLQQLPMGWYSENGGTWAMIPGFDRAEYPGSTRDVQYECMFCHNAYPKIPAANAAEGAEPVYAQPIPNGIDCQRCHGPGQRHIETVSKASATPEEIRASIVNPARLGPEREMEVCMQCHLETSSLKLPHSLQRVDRGPFSYISGQPLADFRLSFDRAPGKNTRIEIAGAAYDLRKSQCFLQTQERSPDQRMQCTTCHDPHNIPRGAEATTHYNSVCNQCHAAEIAKDVAASAHPANADCVSCHMPKRRTDDAVHIVMTDHLIQRRPPSDQLAAKPEYYENSNTSYKGEVVPYYPAKLAPTEANQLDLAVAQAKDDSNLRGGIPQLNALLEKYRPPQAEYYVDLADALHDAGDAAQSAAMYEEALRHAPSSPEILLKLGAAELDWQQTSKVEATARRVTSLTPNDALAWSLLGEVLFQEGKNAEAKDALAKAVSLDVDLAEPHNYLGGVLVRANDIAGAEKEFREAVRLQPTQAPWQANLAGLLASEGKLPEAKYIFELSIKLDPSFAGARINYARLLASTGDNDGAKIQAQAAVDADAKSAEAHEFYGSLLGSLGDGPGAAAELKEAVRLAPDFFQAHLELGEALRVTGDAAGAKAEFKIAARSPDADVRAAAAQLENGTP